MPDITVESVRAEEGDSFTFIVTLSEAAPAAVTVDYQTYSGTALGGVDYGDASGTLTFLAGETSKTLRVFGRSDTLSERDEAFELELFNPVGATFVGRNHSLRTVGWVLDDDAGGGQRSLAVSSPVVVEGRGAAEFVVSLSEAFASQTTLDFSTLPGSAKPGSDFVAKTGTVTFAPGQTDAVVRVNLKNDGKAEPGESFTLKVEGAGLEAAGRARIVDDDARVLSIEATGAEEGDSMTFVVRLSEASSSDVTVGYQTFAGTALGGVDYGDASGTLTFLAGETSKTLRVFSRHDTLSEPDEVFKLKLENPVGARFEKADLAPTAAAFVLDDDPGFQKRILAVSDVRVSEAAGRADFVVSVSRPLDDDLVIRFKTEKGSAKGDKDFVVTKGSVILAAGATEAVASVKVRDDRHDESVETFKLKITGFDRSDFAPSGHDTQATASIVDNDARGRILDWEADSLM